MKPYHVLGLAALSFVIGAIVGLRFGMAGLVGASVFSFAIMFAITYSIEVKKAKRKQEVLPEVRTGPSEGDVVGYGPELSSTRSDEEVLGESHTVQTYMREFNIPRDKAQSIYDAGYRRLGDLSEAIPEDLMMVKGINPTLARKIISTVRGRM
ncbi:MAG: helix-hairpin-helix domain-containing protein [Candidatus Thermoplasmatota archaeon]|jgi:hypothetical protein|nr:helix-hairpin-helix domain-containing protein [Candidatus Thermoplasmatota archaeon]